MENVDMNFVYCFIQNNIGILMCACSHCQETAWVNAGSLRRLEEQKLITVISYTCASCCDMQEDPGEKNPYCV